MKTVLRLIVALPLIFFAVLILGTMLPSKTPEERLAWDIADCQGFAGIRHDTPLMYATTKDYNYGGYIWCMMQRGYSPVPPLP